MRYRSSAPHERGRWPLGRRFLVRKGQGASLRGSENNLLKKSDRWNLASLSISAVRDRPTRLLHRATLLRASWRPKRRRADGEMIRVPSAPRGIDDEAKPELSFGLPPTASRPDSSAEASQLQSSSLRKPSPPKKPL